MNIAMLALVVDGLGIVLLVAVIAYAIRLNRYFNLLRSGKEELASQLMAFEASTRKAESAMMEMRQSTQEHASLLEQQIRRAELVKKDLSRSSYSARGADDLGDIAVSDSREVTGRDVERGRPRGRASSRADRSDDKSRAKAPSLRGGTVANRERPLSKVSESQEQGEVSGKQRAKSKSELLKALQGMR